MKLQDLLLLLSGPLPHATVGDDLDGQLIIYTDMKLVLNGTDYDVVPFETEDDDESEL